MFLGTGRVWWIASGALVLLGLVAVVAGYGAPGFALLLLGMLIFAAAPMRYGRGRAATPPRGTAVPPSAPPTAPPPRERPRIEARDPKDV